ncbi:MAG: hypothetical protein WCT85_00625 [Parachlamydiales bacterium]|jgi:hypothetical protein
MKIGNKWILIIATIVIIYAIYKFTQKKVQKYAIPNKDGSCPDGYKEIQKDGQKICVLK